MSQTNDIGEMVGVYKKLFILLIAVTALGIVLSALHLPLPLTIAVALGIIALKGKIVFDSFKAFLRGRNFLVIVFALTIFFFLMLLLLPLLNHENKIVGTVDLSKAIQAQEQPAEVHHGH